MLSKNGSAKVDQIIEQTSSSQLYETFWGGLVDELFSSPIASGKEVNNGMIGDDKTAYGISESFITAMRTKPEMDVVILLILADHVMLEKVIAVFALGDSHLAHTTVRENLSFHPSENVNKMAVKIEPELARAVAAFDA